VVLALIIMYFAYKRWSKSKQSQQTLSQPFAGQSVEGQPQLQPAPQAFAPGAPVYNYNGQVLAPATAV
jgi:hypothetical protein